MVGYPNSYQLFRRQVENLHLDQSREVEKWRNLLPHPLEQELTPYPWMYQNVDEHSLSTRKRIRNKSIFCTILLQRAFCKENIILSNHLFEIFFLRQSISLLNDRFRRNVYWIWSFSRVNEKIDISLHEFSCFFSKYFKDSLARVQALPSDWQSFHLSNE